MILVHIEFKRVQTWLFSVPRLRAMVGANILLGEMIRVELPKLARQHGKGWELAKNFADTSNYPDANSNDPLKEYDDPAEDAKGGVISRDGGHFEAYFSKGADEFVKAAETLLRTGLPGLRFEISQQIAQSDTLGAAPKRLGALDSGMLSTVLPIFSPCQWSERGLASTCIQQGDEQLVVSADVERRHKAAKRANDVGEQAAKDLVNLLISTTKMRGLERPNDLQELTGTEYLAVIHADGNSVGSYAPPERSKRARFFHHNRVLLRRALQTAINEQYKDKPTGEITLLPLMLGGDDLLLVCRATLALPFIVTLCRQLDMLQRDSKGFKLTLGVGVVIAKPTVPVFRLYQVAETLASSAKRRYRGLVNDKKPGTSVVDWAVYSPAWIDDPVEDRKRDWVRTKGDELYVLSRRPVDVLGKGPDSLERLVEAAKLLQDAPRSQLRYLVEQLFRGPVLADLALAELSSEAKTALRKALFYTSDSGKSVTLWESDKNYRVTSLLDLVEIAEIARLGRTEMEADHG